MTYPLYVVGAGGHCKVVISTLLECGLLIEGILDDDRRKIGTVLLGIPVKETIDNFLSQNKPARGILALGDNKVRKTLYERFASSSMEWISAIHPKAYVHSSAIVGSGTVVFAGAVIQPDSVIGDHCIVNTGALIDHDCFFGDFCHIAPGCRVTGGIKAGEGVFLGAGTTIIPSKHIGEWSTAGAGSTIISDIPPRVTVIGTPAKLLSR